MAGSGHAAENGKHRASTALVGAYKNTCVTHRMISVNSSTNRYPAILKISYQVVAQPAAYHPPEQHEQWCHYILTVGATINAG